MTSEDLAKLIADDDLGLLKVGPKRTPQTTEEGRLLEGFQEILRFVEENGAPPAETNMNERMLFARLESIRQNPAQCEKLRKFDEYGLLNPAPPMEDPPPATLDDILNDDFFTRQDAKMADIFTLKHVPPPKSAESPDYVAQRRPCRDFTAFEAKFQACQRDIKEGRRRLCEFMNEQQIAAGKFYVLHGVLLLVASVGERVRKNGKMNARLRCVFENGTESDMLLRSLATELYKDKDGRLVAPADETALDAMLATQEDQPAGFIYVLRSLSEDPGIKAIPNLHKIGLSRQSVETRIQNAANEPTYLMAPVQLIREFRCFNVDLSTMEKLLHRFFDAAMVRVQVTDNQGNYHTPKEWFSVPMGTISIAVKLLISGEIVNYRYDQEQGQIALAE